MPVRRAARLLAALFVSALSACATVPPLDPSRVAALPETRELEDTPYFAQERNHCGPASAAMALRAAGLEATPDALAPLVYLPARQGSLPLDMLGGARRVGAVAVRLDPSVEALYEQVTAGRPVVVLQNLALSWTPRWHYAVVVGFDRRAETVVLRSGPERRQVLPLATFAKTWDRSGRWGMVVARPGEVPEGVSADRYTESLLASERLGRLADARAGYEAGVARWPDHLTLAMGLGNTAYALGDLAASERAFRAAAAAHPESDAPLNNLAHVLAARDALDEALQTADRAIALAGPNEAVARRTRDEILARRAAPPSPATPRPGT